MIYAAASSSTRRVGVAVLNGFSVGAQGGGSSKMDKILQGGQRPRCSIYQATGRYKNMKMHIA